MSRIARSLLVASLVLSAGLVSGCKKSESGATTAVTASKLPGAAEVMPAIERKDYDAAVAALMKVRDAVTTEAERLEFRTILREAQDKIQEASFTDEKAKEAFRSLALLQTGR